jgi:hypothetical protein
MARQYPLYIVQDHDRYVLAVYTKIKLAELHVKHTYNSKLVTEYISDDVPTYVKDAEEYEKID